VPPVREQPPQQAPPVQRVRLRYAKRGRLRFTSHRDFSRAFERAVVRAQVPVAYSSGFNPHPRISYAGASPTGASSEAEYLEIGLARQVQPDQLREDLDAALPSGLDVLEVVEAEGGPLADRLEASVWRTRVPGLPPETVQDAVDAFLAAAEVPVERMTKKGLRSFDCRAAVVSLQVRGEAGGEAGLEVGGTVGGTGESSGPAETGAPCAILETVLRHGTPSVRPDDVLAGLRSIAGLEAPAAPHHERLAQGPLDVEHGTVGDPLAGNRDAADRR
jgi:radical SAM-linked protein